MTKKAPSMAQSGMVETSSSLQEKRTKSFLRFEDFVNFLVSEDELAHDPFTRALHTPEVPRGTNKGTSFAAESNST